MITIRDNQIRWARADVRLMSRIIGSEAAVVARKSTYRYAPLLPSILRLAKRKRGYLSRRARNTLDAAEAYRQQIEEAKQWNDASLPGTDPEWRKYFKHQRADLSLLYRFKPRGIFVAHEAGVGKTLLGIRYPIFLNAYRKMLIVPNAAKEQWAEEIERWSPKRHQRITIVQGSVNQQIRQIQDARTGWVIGHWESLVHARAGWLHSPWDFALLDEVHHIQNRNAQRSETVFALKADYRMALSAHPYANSVAELFSILRFLHPELYPGFWRWAHLHIEIDEKPFGGLDLTTPRRPKLLQWEIAPFTIRRLWKDVWPNLPPVTHSVRYVHLTPQGRAEYARIKKQFFVALEAHRGEKRILAIPSILARVTRLRQYLIDPGILDAKEKSIKYPEVLELVQELDGTPPVIFSMYREAAVRLKRYLEQRHLRVGLIVGGMQKRINKVKRRFLRGKYDALIVLNQVGGTSLNLGKYGKVIYLDHPWTKRDVEQTTGRVRRPEEGSGKLVPVTVYHIVVKDSYEERMSQIRKDKFEDFSKVFTVEQARTLFA